MNSTNIIFLGFNQTCSVILTLRVSAVSLQFLLGFSLNCYIIFLLLSGRESVDISHVFWVNNAAAEIFFSIFSLLYVIFLESTSSSVVKLIACLCATTQSARLLFLCCVCLERYLAVVHPVTFLRFKPHRYRVGCSVLIWICSLTLSNITTTLPLSTYKLWLVVFLIILAVELFCCVAILRRLKDPGPRDMGNKQGEMNAAKKKAFQIVFINLLTSLTQYIPLVITYSLENILPEYEFTMAEMISNMINIFFICVQPIYILYKAGKLPFINGS